MPSLPSDYTRGPNRKSIEKMYFLQENKQLRSSLEKIINKYNLLIKFLIRINSNS